MPMVIAEDAAPNYSQETWSTTMTKKLLLGARHALKTALCSVEAAMELLQEVEQQLSPNPTGKETSILASPEAGEKSQAVKAQD